jgi:hypothetical protein
MADDKGKKPPPPPPPKPEPRHRNDSDGMAEDSRRRTNDGWVEKNKTTDWDRPRPPKKD